MGSPAKIFISVSEKEKHRLKPPFFLVQYITLRLREMSWGVKTTCLEAPGVSLGGSGVSIGGVGSLRVVFFGGVYKTLIKWGGFLTLILGKPSGS